MTNPFSSTPPVLYGWCLYRPLHGPGAGVARRVKIVRLFNHRAIKNDDGSYGYVDALTGEWACEFCGDATQHGDRAQ